MSRHYFSVGPYHVVMGSDKPLKNVFMDIDKEGQEEPVYDSMMENKNYFGEENIMFYVKIADEQFGIDTPVHIVNEIQKEMVHILED